MQKQLQAFLDSHFDSSETRKLEAAGPNSVYSLAHVIRGCLTVSPIQRYSAMECIQGLYTIKQAHGL